MGIKVGINGFGRFGRVIFRTCIQNPDLNITAINDPAIDIEYICYLIKFDSTHGKLKGIVTHTKDEITINDEQIVKVFHEKLPSSIPWQSAGVQYVIEASGMFTNLEKASGHLASDSVKRVLITAPSVDAPMLILGVNEAKIHCEQKVISCASSTLYCLAPIIKVLEDNFGVNEGFVTSIHAMTPSLKPLDGLCLRGKHWRDHRSIHQNIIPATTGACKALGKIIPQVKDKLTGLAFRVPIVNVSVLDLTIRLTADTTLQDIVTKVEKVSLSSMKNIIKLSTDEAVSSDFIGDSHSCILDVASSLQLKSNFLKLVCWYENEYSYACRVIDSIFFTEKQTCLPNPRCKMTYVRQRSSKKQDRVQQTEYSRKEMSIECNCNTEANQKIICSSSQDVLLIKPYRRRQIILRKPLSANNTGVNSPSPNTRDIKKRNELFRIWNDDNEMGKPKIHQNRSSFFRTNLKMNPQVQTIDYKNENSKAHERLEKVKREFTKMVNITEDLLKKTYSKKFHMNISSKILEENTAMSNKNYGEADNINKINTKEFGKSHKTKNNAMFDVSGDHKAIKINNNSVNMHIKEQRSSYNSIEKDISYYDTNKQEIPSTAIQPSTTVNRDNKEIFQISQNIHLNGKKSDKHPMNCEFKEQVAKTINTLIDGLSQSIQIQSVLIQNDIPKLRNRKIPKPKESVIGVIVNSNTKSNNDSGFFSPVKNEFSGTEVSKEIICSEVLEADIHKEESLYTPENVSKNSNSSKNYESPIKKSPIPTDNHNKVSESRFESFKNRIKNECASIKTDSNKSLILRKKMLQDLNKITHDKMTTRCVSPSDTMTMICSCDKFTNKQDIYDKLDSTSATDSENSFQINERKSQVIQLTDLTNSLEDMERLDKICKIIEISDELSDKLLSSLDNNDGIELQKHKWSFKDLCERIKLDEFCNKLFGKSQI
ncbi:uncharacterized protein ACR2FA_000216 [Aphomia sociella]